MRSLDLKIGPRPAWTCTVRAGRGVLRELVRSVADQPPSSRFVVISDDRVGPLHADPLSARIRDAGLFVDSLVFPEGEASKVRRTKAFLEDELYRLGVGGDVALIAVGGGVVGDLVGFVAATWHRGVPVIQVPTSLLAMVDSALGGKTGVNLPGAKNLVGAYHQPGAVYADVSTLATLDDARYVDGFAEAVKSAVIADAELFGRLEASRERLLERDEASLEAVVAACLRIKASFVADDERDAGRRQALNLGHTVAHALEIRTGHELSHGQAVSIGIVAELQVASEAGWFPPDEVARTAELLSGFGLPTRIPAGTDASDVVETARRDKKSRGGEIRCSLPLGIGRMPPGDDVTRAVEEGRLESVLAGLTD